MVAASITARKLNEVWKHTTIPTKWKILAYNAIVIAKLTYSLDTMSLTQVMEDKLGAFQMKGLRRILGCPPPTMIDRTLTHDKALLELEKQTGKITKLISEIPSRTFRCSECRPRCQEI